MALSFRAQLVALNLDAFLVPSADPHNSEYTAKHFKRREFVTGFHGSAGTAVLLRDHVVLFVDPRYWLQADALATDQLRVVKLGDLNQMTVERWLVENLPSKSRVGFDPEQYSVEAWRKLERALGKSLSLVIVETNPVDALWTQRPAIPSTACWVHPQKCAGRTVSSKLASLRHEMSVRQCDAVIISALDEVMWMLNLRGGDAVESPVFYSYLFVTAQEASFFAFDPSRVPADVLDALDKDRVSVHHYSHVMTHTCELAKRVGAGHSRKVWVDEKSLNFALWSCLTTAKVELESTPTPVALWKAIKNEAEQEGDVI
jgi:Xaa-Pro aminopeptidase